MLQDVRKHRDTEIDFINGHLVDLAQISDIQLAKHTQIIHKIKQL